MIFKNTPCAFHSDEIITNFCKAKECLLPMCPKCIRLHAQEHQESQTKSNFDTLPNVVKDIEHTYVSVEKMMERISDELIEIQNKKKKNQSNIRKRLAESREKLIRQFQKQIIECEETIIKTIFTYDQDIIENLRELDQELFLQIQKVQNHLNELYSDRCLKNIINFYAVDYSRALQSELEVINNKVQELSNKFLCLQVFQKQLKSIKTSISNYMQLTVRQHHTQTLNEQMQSSKVSKK